jgi:peptide/nickel transport system substrate-binding protein
MNMKKLIWLTLSSLIVLVLVLTSCGQATTEKTTTPTEVKGTVTLPVTPVSPTTPTTALTTTNSPASAAPKYGGTLNVIWYQDLSMFDDAFSNLPTSCISAMLTHDELWQGDWTKGPAGTNEVTWGITGFESYMWSKFVTGNLAESWEITGPGNGTVILHIRKGVYWHNKAPTNGRELTSEDVAFSIDRAHTLTTSYLMKIGVKPTSITTPDKYTVVITYPDVATMADNLLRVADFMFIWPKDAVLANNNDMRDWKKDIGTGPYMLTDYVKNASYTTVRNPNYWMKDPVGAGKGNQLPYTDGVKFLIIPDVSTQEAAMRTGKADQYVFNWDSSLIKNNPEILRAKALTLASGGAYFIKFRVDKTDQPWSNIKVRQALHMAVNYEAIKNGFYGGYAEIYSYPAPAIPESKDFFVPMNELPQNVQDLFKYQPDKAKQMLADAGYAKGFDIEVICRTQDIDLLSIVKADWAKIGVNLIITPKDNTVYTSIWNGKSATQSIFSYPNTNIPFKMVDLRGLSVAHNVGNINDPRVEAAFKDIWDNVLDWDKRVKTFKDVTPYILEQAWMIPTPAFYAFSMWQEWVKNYNGETSPGNVERWVWCKYVWIDQNLKQKMTGMR